MTSKSITIPKTVVIVFLASLYSLAFMITPYWRRAESASEIILILFLTILVGTVWVILSGNDLQIKIEPVHWKYLLPLLAISILLNFKPLTSVIPWRGDEDYHIKNTFVLASAISTKWLLAFFVVFFLPIYLAWRKTKWTLTVSVLALCGAIILIWLQNPFTEIKATILFRYPYINYWFFALVPKLTLIFRSDPYQEVLFRVIPFLASFVLVWICQRYFIGTQKIIDLLWGCAVITIPLLYYYSSILYLELPAVLLMTLVCINIPRLLQEDLPELKDNPSWYALILIGFIKETTALFLVCFIAWRLIAFVLKRPTLPTKTESLENSLLQEVKIILAVLLPLVLYLFLRAFQTRNRSFSPNIVSVVDPAVFRAIGQSFIEQLGPFLILFLAGCFLLLRRKEYLVLGFLMSLFILYPLFFAFDTARYAGYSRFNLFILPPVLATAGVVIRELIGKQKLVSIILAGAILVVNIWMSPVNLDGTKKPYWGNYLADTSEHYYPYREAVEWLKTNHSQDRILFTGMHYPYISFAFYFSKFDWEPDNKILLTENTNDQMGALSEALARAATENFDVLCYQIEGNEIPQIADLHGFAQEKIVENDAQMLIIYSRKLASSK